MNKIKRYIIKKIMQYVYLHTKGYFLHRDIINDWYIQQLKVNPKETEKINIDKEKFFNDLSDAIEENIF